MPFSVTHCRKLHTQYTLAEICKPCWNTKWLQFVPWGSRQQVPPKWDCCQNVKLFRHFQTYDTHIHTYIYVHTHIYIHTYTRTCIHTYMNIHIYVHIYTHMYIHTHTYIHTRTYVRTYIRGGDDKSLAPTGRKQATATKLGIYSTHSPRSSTHFLARCSTFCKPLKKIQKVVRPTRSPRQQWPQRRAKNGDLSIVFFTPGNRW